MRVLLLNDLGTPRGGAELMSAALRDELRARGHEARLLTSRASDGPAPRLADELCWGSMSALGTLMKTANPFNAWAARRLLASFRPDIVHVRMFMTQLSPAILPVLWNTPALYHAVSFETLCPTVNKTLPDGTACSVDPGWVCRGCLSPPAWAAAMLQRRLWLRWKSAFDRVVANSAALGAHLARQGLGEIEVIPNGVPETPARPPLADPPTVSYAGRLAVGKGLEVLLRAFRTLVQSVPSAQLRIAGQGACEAALRRETAQLGLGAAVRWLGEVPRAELEVLLADAWVHVVPSLVTETFGLTATEAMMRGTAVVASRVGGLSEQVEDGRCGLLVPADAPDALANALRRLLQNRELCEKLGAAARARALAHFTIGRCVGRFERLYARLCAGGREEGDGR